MKVSGITPEGKHVCSGLFKMVGTHGVPLELVLGWLQENNKVMDWVDYCTGALNDGHNPGTIRARITTAVGDVYGPVHSREVGKRLDTLFE